MRCPSLNRVEPCVLGLPCLSREVGLDGLTVVPSNRTDFGILCSFPSEFRGGAGKREGGRSARGLLAKAHGFPSELEGFRPVVNLAPGHSL